MKSPAPDFKRKTSTSTFKTSTSTFRLQSSDFRLQTSDFRLQVSKTRSEHVEDAGSIDHVLGGGPCFGRGDCRAAFVAADDRPAPVLADRYELRHLAGAELAFRTLQKFERLLMRAANGGGASPSQERLCRRPPGVFP